MEPESIIQCNGDMFGPGAQRIGGRLLCKPPTRFRAGDGSALASAGKEAAAAFIQALRPPPLEIICFLNAADWMGLAVLACEAM